MIENEDDACPAGNDAGINRLDASKEKPQGDPEKGEYDSKRDGPAPIEDEIFKSELFVSGDHSAKTLGCNGR